MGDYRNPPYVIPASASRPPSPTGSIKSSASKVSTTRSRMKGALHKVKKTVRSNFITEGFAKLNKSTDSWGDVIPTLQPTQDGVPLSGPSLSDDLAAAARAFAAGAADNNDEDSDNSEDSDSLKSALEREAYEAEAIGPNPNAPPPTLEVPASAGTPPNQPGSLPDPNLTPRSPRVAQATEAELYKLRQTAILEDRDRNIDPFTTQEPFTTPQFEAQVDQSKTIIGDFADEEIAPSSPQLPHEMHTLTNEQIKEVHDELAGVGRIIAAVSPHMITNPHRLAEVVGDFMSSILNTDWAKVPVDGISMEEAFKRRFKRVEFRDVPVVIRPPTVMTREDGSSAPALTHETLRARVRQTEAARPTQPSLQLVEDDTTNVAMEVDPAPTPRIPAELKGKGKAIPTPTPPPAPIKPASPIKISAVPRPLPLPSVGPSKPRAPAWVAKLKGKDVYEAHFSAQNPQFPPTEWRPKGKSQPSDTQSSSRAPQAAAPQRDNKSARISSGTQPSKAKQGPPPPIPYATRPTAQETMMARVQSTAQTITSRDKKQARLSYAQTAAVNKNAKVIPALTKESLQWAQELRASFPELSVREALELTLPQQANSSAPSSNGRKSASSSASAARTQGISNGLNRKSAQFAFSHIIREDLFADMGHIVNEMNRHLSSISSPIRIQNGRLFKSVVHFYLNLAPTQPQFDRIKEALFKVLQKEAPAKGSEDPFAPQSIAHLIMKGFDYYTNIYNRRPEDILTGEQVMQKMQGIDQFRGLECVRPPAVVRSKGSNDMAIAFVDVWDSKNGIRTKDIVNKVYHMGGKLIKVEYARQREFVPQCQNCWAWTHGTSRCRINHQRCARCGQPHKTANHDLFATCCRAVRKTTDYTGKCEHPIKCINCKGNHTANDSKCVYKRHQNNVSWHAQRRESDYAALKEKRSRQKKTITQAFDLPPSEIIEITSSSE